MSDAANNDGSEATQTETDSKGNQSGAVTEERAKRKAAQDQTRLEQERNAQLQAELEALRNQNKNSDDNEVHGLNISEEDVYNPRALQQKMDEYVTRKIDDGLATARKEVQQELSTRDLKLQMKEVREGIEIFQDDAFGRHATEILESRAANATLTHMDDYRDIAMEVAKDLSALKANQSAKNDSTEGEFEPTKPTAGAGGEVTQLNTEPKAEKRTWSDLMDAGKERAGKFSAKWHADRNQGN